MAKATPSKRKGTQRKGRGFVRHQRRFFLLPRRQITAVDIDGEVLRVVQTVRRNGRTVVTRLAAEALKVPAENDWSDPVVMGNCVARALQRLKLRPGSVVMGVPRALVVLRTISVPTGTDPRELAAMVHFQVAKDLPFPLEEAVIDFKLMRSRAPKPEEGPVAEGVQPKPGVLVALVKREVVEFYQKIADTAGLKLTALGLRSYANARCLEACGVTADREAIALVSLRPDEVIIDVLEEQSLVFSRVATVRQPSPASGPAAASPPTPSPAAPASAPASAVTELQELPVEGSSTEMLRRLEEMSFPDAVMIEVVRSLHSYQGMGGHQPVTKLVVAGGTGNEPAVVQALRKRLSVTCEHLDPTLALDLPESEREHASGALAVFGLALGVNDVGGLPFDFLKPKRPPTPINKARIRAMAMAAAAIFLVFGVAVVRTRLANRRLQAQREISRELTALSKQRPLFRRLQLQTKTVQDWLSEGDKWLDHYAYLSTVLPPSKDVYLNSVSSSTRGSIRLAVQARSGEVLAQLDRQLRAAGYDVKPLAITPVPDKSGYPFRSSVELLLPADFQIDWLNGIVPATSRITNAPRTKAQAKDARPSSPAPAKRAPTQGGS